MGHKKINIAIDGVAGSGKGSSARLLAEKLGLRYLDTGAMYRAVGYVFQGQDRNPEYFVPSWLYDLDFSLNEKGHICQSGEDLEPHIRTSQVALNASVCAAIPEIREYLQKFQKEVVKEGGWVAEGRDIGYAVMPDADVKFFMTASVEERARRRQKDYAEQGIDKTLEEVIKMIEERDHRDSTREHTPLKQLPDAIVIDTSDYALDEQVEAMYKIASEKITQL